MSDLFNKNYYLKLDNIVQYCSGSGDDKTTQSDIVELYKVERSTNLELVQKQINNSIINNGQLKTIDTYKYDLIKGLLQILFQIGFNVDGSEVRNELTIGEQIVFNTLLINEFLMEIK